MDEISNILHRMRELAIQSASGSYTDEDRASMDAERASLLSEINNIADSSKFNGRLLLDGTFKDIIAQIGANADEYIDVDIEKIEGIKLGEYWNLGFENNDFSETTPTSTSGTTVSIPGWTIELSQIALGPDDTSGAGGVPRSQPRAAPCRAQCRRTAAGRGHRARSFVPVRGPSTRAGGGCGQRVCGSAAGAKVQPQRRRLPRPRLRTGPEFVDQHVDAIHGVAVPTR